MEGIPVQKLATAAIGGAIIAFLSFLPGCGGEIIALGLVGGGATGGTLYVRGELRSTETTTPPEAIAASKAALKDLGIVLLSSSADELGGEIVARTATDDKVSIKAEFKSNRVTEVRIRIGVFGNQALSREILSKIETHLPKPPTTGH